MSRLKSGMTFACAMLIGSMVVNAKNISESGQAEKVFSAFFHAMGKPYRTGLPDEALQKKLSPYFSKGLAKLLLEAEHRQDECLAIGAKINRDILKHTKRGETPAILKPAMIEGSIFAMQYESPDGYKVIKSNIQDKNTLSLVVEYSYHDSTAASAYHWKSKVILINENDQWRIDNFIEIPLEAGNTGKPDDVRSSLNNFPSCINDYKNYEKDNSYRH